MVLNLIMKERALLIIMDEDMLQGNYLLFLYYSDKQPVLYKKYKFTTYRDALNNLFNILNHDTEVLVGKIIVKGEDEPLITVHNF